MDELSQLKVILKNSFAGIKKDMTDLREKQEESISSSSRFKQDVDAIKEDYASKDKLNIVKIKVGEISDMLKKLWDLDSSIKQVDDKKADKKEFEERFQKLREEISKKLSETSSGTSRKIIEHANAVNKTIETVNNNSAKIFSKIGEQMKVVATKSQLKELASNVTGEFVALKKEVAEIKKIKDTITAAELEKRSNLLNARVDLLAKEVLKANQNVSHCVSSEQVKGIVDEINREFDDLKSSAQELGRVKKYIGMLESESLSKKDFAKQIAGVHSEIDAARKEMRELRDSSRDYARNDYVEKNMNRIESILMRKVLDLEKEVIALKRFERRYDSDAVETKKEEKSAEIRARPEIKKEAKPRKPFVFLSAVSIILIVLAFVSLAGAILEYFALEPALTNYLTIGAVVLFVVGIVLRIVVIKKRK